MRRSVPADFARRCERQVFGHGQVYSCRASIQLPRTADDTPSTARRWRCSVCGTPARRLGEAHRGGRRDVATAALVLFVRQAAGCAAAKCDACSLQLAAVGRLRARGLVAGWMCNAGGGRMVESDSASAPFLDLSVLQCLNGSLVRGLATERTTTRKVSLLHEQCPCKGCCACASALTQSGVKRTCQGACA